MQVEQRKSCTSCYIHLGGRRDTRVVVSGILAGLQWLVGGFTVSVNKDNNTISLVVFVIVGSGVAVVLVVLQGLGIAFREGASTVVTSAGGGLSCLGEDTA